MPLISRWIPDKTEVVAERGMVVAKQPLAARAGIEILEEGGNAVDAAVAMGFALAVCKPMMTCIAGIGYLLAHDAARGQQWCFDGAPRAPLAAHAGIYEVIGENSDGVGLSRVRGDENNEGYRAAAVPGLVAILCTAHERLGRLPLARVLEPAITLAQDGWPADWVTALHAANEMPKLSRNAAAAAIFLPNGFPPRSSNPPSLLKQRDLAETLKRIARAGADGFYRGEVAGAIAADMHEGGGLITMEDLARFPRRVDPPLRGSYRGYDVLIPPMPCGATTALETLRILERFDLAAAGHNSVEALHLFVEAARRAFADRFYYLGDPEFVSVPVAGLLADGHTGGLAGGIDRSRTAFAAAPGDPEPWLRFAGTPPPGDPWRYDPGERPAAPHAVGAPIDSDDCTTHYAVVDVEHNAVCCTITAAGLFGAGVVTPGTGVLWNNGMTWFNPSPGAVNSIAPGKRALTNMAPAMLLRDGHPYLLIGAPGGRKIINAVAHIISNVVDHGLSMQAAVAAPRVDASANETLADVRLDPAVVAGLRARGHSVSEREDVPGGATFARPVGILVDPIDGRLHSGLTPFHVAEARGL